MEYQNEFMFNELGADDDETDEEDDENDDDTENMNEEKVPTDEDSKSSPMDEGK